MNSMKTLQVAPKDVRVLLVNWNDNNIGYLVKEENGDYLYKYNQKGLSDARKKGYQYLIGFKDTRKGKVYSSKELFPVFKSRIPTRQRRDLDEILAKLGIKDYDEFDLLALSGGKLFTDSISFKECVPNKEALGRKLDTITGKKDKIEKEEEVYGR